MLKKNNLQIYVFFSQFCMCFKKLGLKIVQITSRHLK